MRHFTILRFLMLFACIITYGCLPLPYTYHEPSAPGGVRIHSPCHGLAPRDTIEFRIEDIKIQIKASSASVAIDILVPEGKSAQLESDEILLYEDKPENSKLFKIVRSRYYDFKQGRYFEINSTDLMIGNTYGLFSGDRPFTFWVYPDEKERDHFYIRIPPLRVGERRYEFPTIEFLKKTGFGILPVNC